MKKVFLLLAITIMFTLPTMMANSGEQSPSEPSDREEGTTTCTTEWDVEMVGMIPTVIIWEECTSEV